MMCSLELNTGSARTSWDGNEKVLLEIPVSQGDKEGKSKLEVSNPYLRQQLKGFCRDEGLEKDSSIDHFGIKKRTCFRRLGKRCQQEERHGKGEWVLSKMLEVFQRQYLTTGAQKTHHYGPCATQDLVARGLRDLHNSKNQDQGKKKQASFDIAEQTQS